MSHPVRNPAASGNHGSAQRPYEPSSAQAVRDPSRASPPLGSSFSSSATPASSERTFPTTLACPDTERPKDPLSNFGDPKFSVESAVNLLHQFGLEKEDLELLITFPEDQTTPENLPFILQQICMLKTKQAATTIESKPFPQPPEEIQPGPRIVQDSVPQGISAPKPAPSPPSTSRVKDCSPAPVGHAVVPGVVPTVVPPVAPQQTLDLLNPPHVTLPPSFQSQTKKDMAKVVLPVSAVKQKSAVAVQSNFPQTCLVCNKECSNMKEWISHQTSAVHLEICRRLQKGDLGDNVTTRRRRSRSRSRHECSSDGKRDKRSSRSRSTSRSRRRYRSPEGRREKHRGRSRSPRSFKHTRRSRSRSSSRWNQHATSSRYRSRSRSKERRSRRKKEDRRSSSRSASPSRRLSPERRKLSDAKILAKKLLETTASQSLSNQSDLETVVKALAPALLAELANIKSSPASTSVASSSSSFSNAAKRMTTGSPAPPKLAPSTPPTMLKLAGICGSLSHNEVISAVEKFGKTKSVLLFRSRGQASVCFEKVEDAEKLRSVGSLQISGKLAVVIREPGPVSKKTPPTSAEERTKQPNVLSPVAGGSSGGKEDNLSVAKAMQVKPSEIQPETAKTTIKSIVFVPGKPKTDASHHQRGVPVTEAGPSTNTDPTSGSLQYQDDPSLQERIKKHLQPEEIRAVKETFGQTGPVSKKTPPTSAEERTKQPNVLSPVAGGSSEGKDDNLSVAKAVQVKPSEIQPETAKTTIKSIVFVPGKPKTDASQHQRGVPVAEAGPSTNTDPTSGSLQYQDDPSLQERIKKHLQPEEIRAVRAKLLKSKMSLPHSKRVLVMSNLPKYSDGGYSEEDVAELLFPFKFRRPNEHVHNIYVLPQACTAFAHLSGFEMMRNVVLKASEAGNCPQLHGNKLRLGIVNMPMSPFEFYKTLMSIQGITTNDNGVRTIYIENISACEAANLKEVLKKIGRVKNHLLLLNKAFIEFENILDVDRFGVWHSLLKRARGYRMYRLKPEANQTVALQPKVFLKGIPDAEAINAGAVIPPTIPQIPAGSVPPFWVPMNTYPFVFSTSSIWFNVPEHLTISDEVDPENLCGSVAPTVMLTGFPICSYNQEDVAKLVQPYVPQQDPHFLYYNLTVLPLQNRAFIHFRNWGDCSNFLQNHLRSCVLVRSSMLTVHLVREDMRPGFTEETMYRNLMGWSNSNVPDLEALDERLLCVEISELTLGLVTGFMKVLASVAPFVGFLPLANRLCIEMAEPRGVALVVKMFLSLQFPLPPYITSKVQSIKTVESLKESFKDAIHLKCVTKPTTGPLAAQARQPPSAPPFFPPPVPRPIAAGPGQTTLQENGGKQGKETGEKITTQKQGAAPHTGQAHQPPKAPPPVALPVAAGPGNASKASRNRKKKKNKAQKEEAAPDTEFQIGSSVVESKKERLTQGEILAKSLNVETYPCHRTPEAFTRCIPVVLLSNLPPYNDGAYTEEDLYNLLVPFAPRNVNENATNVYGFPEARLAFVTLSGKERMDEMMDEILEASEIGALRLKGTLLQVHLPKIHLQRAFLYMRPFNFYETLIAEKNPINRRLYHVVHLSNISPDEARELRDILASRGCLRNYLPLLNQVFIECTGPVVVDQLGFWHSLLKRARSYRLHKRPCCHNVNKVVVLPDLDLEAEAELDLRNFLDNVTMHQVQAPAGEIPPFGVTMTTDPFMFRTTFTWFRIPDHMTINTIHDTNLPSRSSSSEFRTIMMTSLPARCYKHKDIARLVWADLPNQDLQDLYYRVTALPLQGRAFVHFSSWETCHNFISRHMKKQSFVQGKPVFVHLVFQDMEPGFSEETMYRSLMKWSNCMVPDLETLQERLLSVEMAKVNLSALKVLMEEVTSVAPVRGFLPLANRIVIEMADPSGVTKVLERRHMLCTSHPCHIRDLFGLVESMKSLKQRLQDSSGIKVNLEPVRQEICQRSQFAQESSKGERYRQSQDASRHEPMDQDGSRDSSAKAQPEPDRRLEKDFIVIQDSDKEEGPAGPEVKEPESNASVEVKEEVTEDQTTAVQQDVSVLECGDKSDKTQVLDTSSEESTSKEERKDTPREDEKVLQQSSRAFKDDDRVQRDLKSTEQEAFQNLDSIDDPTERQEDIIELKAPSDQTCEAGSKSLEEDDVSQMIESMDGQEGLTRESNQNIESSKTEEKEKSPEKHGMKAKNKNTETKDRSTERGQTPRTSVDEGKGEPREDEKVPEQSAESFKGDDHIQSDKDSTEQLIDQPVITDGDEGPTTETDQSIASSETEKKEKSPKKQERTAKTKETQMKVQTIKESPEETIYEVRDSVDDEAGQETAEMQTSGRRRSTRGRKAIDEEETKYTILDSVEEQEDAASEEATVSSRSTRGRRGRTSRKEASDQDVKEEERTSRTPVREPRDPNQEEPLARAEERAPKQSSSSEADASQQATFQILDSVEDQVAPPTAPPTRKRGRPKKAPTKPGRAPKKNQTGSKAAKQEVEEEEAAYQVVDSVEDETGDQKTTVENTSRDEMTAEDAEDAPVAPTRTKPEESGKGEEETEAPPTRARVRPAQRSRQTPVRRSTRGRKEAEPPAASSVVDKESSEEPSSAEGHQEGTPEGKRTMEEERRFTTLAVEEELLGPEAKRPRSGSPEQRSPRRPLGQEYLVPQSGFFCRLCSVFYSNHDTAMKVHCSSQRHYRSLENYYQKLQEDPSKPPQH